jgi:signal transduction histidine kinase
MIFWYLYSFHHLDREHVQAVTEMQTIMTKENFAKYISGRRSQIVRIVNKLENYDLELDTYKEILDALDVKWYKLDKQHKNLLAISLIDQSNKVKAIYVKEKHNLDNAFSFYDMHFNKNNNKHELVAVYLIPLKAHKFDGIFVSRKVQMQNIIHNRPPVIIRLYNGNDIDRNNLIYLNAKPPGLRNDRRIIHPPEPDFSFEDVKLKGQTLKINNYRGDVIATLIIGVPDNKKPLWFIPNPFIDKVFRKMYLIGALIPLMGIVLSIITGYYLKKYYINPVVEISKACNEVISGNLSVRVNPECAEKEIRETLIRFNKMIDSLKEKTELRDNFISNLSHDLKTPLLAENKTLELLPGMIEENDINAQKDLINALIKNNNHLLNMVDLLLETYQFEETKLIIKKKEINLEELVKHCYEQLKPLAIEKNISLEYNIDTDLSYIYGDYKYIKRCFINIIVNAIENIPKNSTIKVNATKEDMNTIIRFKDNGHGIPEMEKEKLFDKYYSGKRTERKLGSGLGLYICKKFIEAHNGNISVSSVQDEYTEFIIYLPHS